MLAVAEWLRRRAVTPATRVRFSPVNPVLPWRTHSCVPRPHSWGRWPLSGYRSRDRIERYERSDCRSSRHTRTNPAFVQSGEDAALRTLKFRFESGGLDQFCAVVAERQRHPAVHRDQEGSTPFHRATRGADDRSLSSALCRRWQNHKERWSAPQSG